MGSEDKRVSDVIDGFQRKGLYGFERAQLDRVLSASSAAISKALSRLAAKGRIKRIRKGFYIIIPVEYTNVGMLPADWFLDDLMKSLGIPYYLGLQSAAALYGAAHQQAQQVQVVIATQERTISRSGLTIRFFRKSTFSSTPLQSHKAHGGMLPVSSPEGTALDLIRYAPRIGGLDSVITILTELSESLKPEKLAATVRSEPESAQVQRLGWLLDHLAQKELADALHAALPKGKTLPRTRLDPGGAWGGHSTGNRWRVLENAQPQSDL